MTWFARHCPACALDDRFLAFLVALCTKVMDGFASSFIFFKRIEEHSRIVPLQFIALLICFPDFHASNFFFKIVYRPNQLRLFRLDLEQGGLRRSDLAIQLDRLFEELRRVPQTDQSLSDIARRADRLKSLCESQ